MNVYVGFSFTEGPILDLRRRGFVLEPTEDCLEEGYRAFTAQVLSGAENSITNSTDEVTAFQIREVIEEQEYLKYHKVIRLEPFQQAHEVKIEQQNHANTVVSFKSALTSAEVEAGPLRTYFEIRKSFSLWALWLECQDFSLFCRTAQPDRIFEWRGSSAGLVHLGPNCFDLLVSQQGTQQDAQK